MPVVFVNVTVVALTAPLNVVPPEFVIVKVPMSVPIAPETRGSLQGEDQVLRRRCSTAEAGREREAAAARRHRMVSRDFREGAPIERAPPVQRRHRAPAGLTHARELVHEEAVPPASS